jgi:hypothetical protein
MRLAKATSALGMGLAVLLVIGGATVALGVDPDPFAPVGECPPPADVAFGSVLGEIVTTDPDSLTCEGYVTFDLLPGGEPPGTNYDGLIMAGGAAFGDHFAGQTVTYDGYFDVIGGAPTGPLSLMAGPPNQNLSVVYYGSWHSNVLSGLGPEGYPSFDAMGEGAVAVLFEFDQSVIGFDVTGGNDGNAFVNFYKRDGSYFDTFILTDLESRRFAFRRIDGSSDIGGITIHTDDPGGIALDYFCYSLEPGQGEPPACSLGGPFWGYAGTPITYDGSECFDPDGDIVSWEWDFGDGAVGSGQIATHTYATDGFFLVMLCVTDNDGNTACCQAMTVVSCSAVEARSWGCIKGLYR